MSLMAIREFIATPMGSSIEALGGGHYRVCDSRSRCAEVEGLWTAGELVREMELRSCSPELIRRQS